MGAALRSAMRLSGFGGTELARCLLLKSEETHERIKSPIACPKLFAPVLSMWKPSTGLQLA